MNGYRDEECSQKIIRGDRVIRPLSGKPPLRIGRQILETYEHYKQSVIRKQLPPIATIQISLTKNSNRNSSSLERNKENQTCFGNKISLTPRRSEINYFGNNQTNSLKISSERPSSAFNKSLIPPSSREPPRKNSSFSSSGSHLKTDSSSKASLLNSSTDSLNRQIFSAKMTKLITSADSGSIKPRILSSKRSQNPDLDLLDAAHPFIQTDSCVPICKFQIRFLQIKIKLLSIKAKKQITSLPPSITSKSWVLFDGISGQFIDGKCVHNQREVASLTKIMTCYTVLSFFQDTLKKDMTRVYFKVSQRASSMSGTSAKLREHMIVSVWDLLHGLMLPSGNDSAMCLAENVGSLMFLWHIREDYEIKSDFTMYNENVLIQKLENETTPSQGLSRFMYQMNQNGSAMSLINTHFSNPHGLKNPLNKSSAYDVAKVCDNAMRLDSFKHIVNTKQHKAVVKHFEDNEYSLQKIVWDNTNKLLEKGWAGIKTGVTDTAGPCLATCIKVRDPINDLYRCFIIVILHAQSMDIRWEETQKIAAWAIENVNPDL